MKTNENFTNVFSEEYLEWVKQCNLLPLTNTQHEFAEFLLLKENRKMMSSFADLDSIFCAIRKYLKR
jgi:hypothetical protein